MSISDINLLLSEKESFGLVLLEAMACGVPCIGTNIGGIPEVIQHKENGYIEELGDVQAFADRILTLLEDKEKYLQFSRNAINHVKTNFSSDQIRNQYERLYQKVLGVGHE